MKVEGLYIDRILNAPILFLRERNGNRILPVWIGAFEAMAISLVIQHQNTERPMTHDLMKVILKTLDASLQNVVIQEIENGTFYARMRILKGNSIYEIDARPSDSIALALRCDAPIFVEEGVMEEGGSFVFDESLQKNLERLSPEEFGRFKL